jgi:hypothetical protein
MIGKFRRIMRKRAVIGLLAMLAIGMMVFVVLQPKRGSVEWHNSEYLASAKRLTENRLIDRVKSVFCRVTGKARRGNPAARESQEMARMEEHRKALVQSGYLAEKQFALKYRAVDQIKIRLPPTTVNPPRITKGQLWTSNGRDTVIATAAQQVIGHFRLSAKQNTIVVTGSREVIAACEDEIRKADVP